MGYHHGQDIVPTREMLCVQTGKAQARTWTAVGQPGMPVVTVESLKGALTAENRQHASFALSITQAGAPVDTASVRLLARMPHHDRRLPGGHGAANDPDVKGVPAQAAGAGRYTVPLVDLTMDGPWLFEIQIQGDTTTHKVYVAPTVGEN